MHMLYLNKVCLYGFNYVMIINSMTTQARKKFFKVTFREFPGGLAV